jgi:hypothetical protein
MKLDHIELYSKDLVEPERGVRVAAFSTAAVLTIGLIAWLSLGQFKAVTRTEHELEAATRELNDVKRMIASLPKPAEKGKGPTRDEVVGRFVRKQPLWSDALKELSLLPSGEMWLTALTAEFSDGAVQFDLTGEAPSQRIVSDFFARLENSFYFRESHFKYSEQLAGMRPSLFRFRITSSVRPRQVESPP